MKKVLGFRRDAFKFDGQRNFIFKDLKLGQDGLKLKIFGEDPYC